MNACKDGQITSMNKGGCADRHLLGGNWKQPDWFRKPGGSQVPCLPGFSLCRHMRVWLARWQPQVSRLWTPCPLRQDLSLSRGSPWSLDCCFLSQPPQCWAATPSFVLFLSLSSAVFCLIKRRLRSILYSCEHISKGQFVVCVGNSYLIPLLFMFTIKRTPIYLGN